MYGKNSEQELLGSNQKAQGKLTVSAVIVAAGKGTRMGAAVNKQMLSVCGAPVIARTISPFEDCRLIDEIIIVASEKNIVPFGRIVQDYGFRKAVRIVRGGETRQRSAYEGLKAVNGRAEFIAIHDGARPLITADEIGRVARAAFEYGAAAAAVKVKDTIKIASAGGMIEKTPERSRLWAVQTPQIFSISSYREALESALRGGRDYTDDCQLLESIGKPVRLVECGYTNIKITTREDILIAESLITARGERE